MATTPSIRVDEFKAAAGLPTSTGVALTLLRLTQDDQLPLHTLSDIVAVDPALSGRLVGTANSLQMSGLRPVVSIPEAVLRLGGNQARRNALGFTLLSDNPETTCESFDYAEYWLTSLATAVAARLLVEDSELMPPQEAYATGLLSQVGRLALAHVHPEAYAQVLHDWDGVDEGALLRLEQEAFAIGHNELSASIVGTWGLPSICIEAIRNHHAASEEPHSARPRSKTLTDVLWLARGLSQRCFNEHYDPDRPGVDWVRIPSRIGKTGRELRVLYERMLAEWADRRNPLLSGMHDLQVIKQLLRQARERSREHKEDPSETVLPAAMPLRILAVDDSELDLKLLTLPLTKAGHTVETAHDGPDGLRKAMDGDYQLMITDWLMPGMEGPDLCRALRQTEKGRRLYIIILTAYEEPEALVQAFEAGADDYIVKPFKPKALTARIRSAQRIISLQEEVDRDKDEIKRYVAALSVANRKLEHTALTDELTDLPNRRYAMERLAQEWSAHERSGKSTTCMIVDIDHFKRVNDTHGHDVGDVVLRQTAQMMKRTARRSDNVCRFGGEEFLILCPDLDHRDAPEFAERLRRAVESNVVRTRGFDGNVTVSIGIAVLDETVSGVDDLIRRADEALYTAKEQGRNRVHLFEGIANADAAPA